MAKLPRTTQKIFAKNAAAGQVTTFGSIKDGTPVYSTSAGDIMNSNFEDGWSAAVEDDYAPYRQDRNGVDTAVTQQLAYLFQEGIPEYDSGTVYYKGSICKVTDGTGVKIYKSIYDNHSAAVTNTSRWHLILNVDSSNNIVSPSISSPTISGGSMSNGTFANPTFSGTVNVPLASASSSTDSTIAASIGWANNPNLSSNIVHKTGDETIAGDKTFTGYIKGQAISNTNHAMKLGANGSDYMDFYEYGGLWNFYKSRNSTNTLVGKIAELTSSTDDETLATTNWVNNRGFALDSAVVKTSGDQTISGSKTFTGTLQTTTNIVYKKTALTKGTNPESTTYWQFFLADKNGSGDANSLGKIQTSVDSNGLVQTSMVAYKNASGTSSERISIYYPTSGSAYTYAPTPATSDNSTKIATTAYVKAQGYALDNDVVKTSGDQTINGNKTYSNSLAVQGSGNAPFVHKRTSLNKGTPPSGNNVQSRWRMTETSGVGNANTFGGMEVSYNTNGAITSSLQAFKPELNSTTNAAISITYPVTGDPYTSAPTPASSDNSTKISTTAFVKSVLSTSGNGFATFDLETSSPNYKGYMELANGWIIQWGITAIANQNTSITLPTPFSNNHYAVCITSMGDAGVYQRLVSVSTARTTTNFTTYSSGGAISMNFSWIAIGK